MDTLHFKNSQTEEEGLFAIRGNLDGEGEPEFSEREQFIGLIVNSEVFYLHISYVNEIVMLEPIRFVPKAPKYIEGVVNLRGNILPAINLRKMMGHPRGQASPSTRIVIIKHDNQLAGLLVDGISTVVGLLPSEIEERSITAKGTSADLVGSMSKRQDQIIGIFDLDRIMHLANEGRIVHLDEE